MLIQMLNVSSRPSVTSSAVTLPAFPGHLFKNCNIFLHPQIYFPPNSSSLSTVLYILLNLYIIFPPTYIAIPTIGSIFSTKYFWITHIIKYFCINIWMTEQMNVWISSSLTSIIHELFIPLSFKRILMNMSLVL